jgi:hypothetical protein
MMGWPRAKGQEQHPAYEESYPGLRIYPPGERVEVQRTPARLSEKPPPRGGPLDPDPVISHYCGRHRTDVAVRYLK